MIAIDPLPEDKAREVVHQIVDGVQHLHALNIVHLDLKVRGCRVVGLLGVVEKGCGLLLVKDVKNHSSFSFVSNHHVMMMKLPHVVAVFVDSGFNFCLVIRYRKFNIATWMAEPTFKLLCWVYRDNGGTGASSTRTEAYTYIHTYIHIHTIHTRTHTNTHTQTHSSDPVLHAVYLFYFCLVFEVNVLLPFVFLEQFSVVLVG